MSAVRSSTSRSASASTSMPSIPSVPLISARPSLARSVSGATPAVATGGRAVDQRAVGQARLALAEQHERRRRQRGEVAAGAERAVLADDRRDAGVEQGEHRVDDDAARAPEKPIARLRARSRTIARTTSRSTSGAHPGGVRADQRRLQLGRALGRDHRVGQRAEPGGHAVDRLGLVDEPLDDGGAALDRGSGVVAEHDRPIVPGDGDDVGRDAVGRARAAVVGHAPTVPVVERASSQPLRRTAHQRRSSLSGASVALDAAVLHARVAHRRGPRPRRR